MKIMGQAKQDRRIGNHIIRAWLVNSACASFEVIAPISFEYTNIATGERVEQTTFHKRGEADGMAWTSNIDESSVIAYGDVKFDGCTNLIVQEDEDCMVHTCSLAGFERLLAAVAEARKFAASLLGADQPANEEYAAASS